MIEASAKLSNTRISPKKIRLVADAIRGLDVNKALERLQVIFKKSSPVLEKLLKSAVANAIDKFEVKEEDLRIKTIMVDKALDYKRWRPAAFGRAHKYNKHGAHVKIVLTAKEGIKATSRAKDKVEIETVDLTSADKKTTKEAIKDNKVTDKKSNTKVSGNKADTNPQFDKTTNTKVKKG